MKKNIIKLGALVCAFVMSVTCFAACSGREKTVNDGKTVNVRVFLGGFGSDWIYELKDKFESAYEKEGYKINVLTPANDNQSTVVVNELASKNSGVDLYFTEAVTIESVTHGDYGMLVEDLSEIVYDQSPIGFDGKEEEGKIRDKIKLGVADNKNTYYNGKEYGFCWIASAGGLTVNMAKLNKYELEVPNTTDELIECFDAIYKGKTLSDGTTIAGSKVTGTYPHTMTGGSSGYPQMMYQTWLAQYMGLEEYGKFMSFTDDDGNYRLTDGYEAYNEDGLYEMLKVSYQVFDRTYMSVNSTTQDADNANAAIMKKTGAVFLANGNWMLNEVKLNYGEESKSLRFFKVPVISALGTKVFGGGTTANITDSKKCDEVLSKVVSYIDDNKTSEEIVALLAAEGVTATAADVDRIVEARNMYFSRSFNENAYITKDSQVKDIAALFLRMYASSDNAELFERTANAFTATDSRTEVNNEYDFVNDTAKIVNNKDSIAFNGLKDVSGLRKEMSQGALLVGVSYLANRIVQDQVTKYGASTTGTNEVYAAAAKKLFDSNYATAKSKWSEWLNSAGYGQ